MKRSFTLIELLLVLTLLVALFAAVVISTNNFNSRNSYDEAKEQLKSYIVYNKYRALDQQTNVNVTINVEQNSIYSLFDDEITWLNDFTNNIQIINSSSTNIVFNSDGNNKNAYIDVVSIDNLYSNRLYINEMGMLKYMTIPNTNNISDNNNDDEFPDE